MDFKKLSERQQKALLEKYRNINVDDSWWYQSCYDDVKSDMEEIGFSVTHCYFSGFWSQGDGACFIGFMDDAPKFVHAVADADAAKYPFLRKLLERDAYVSYRLTTNSFNSCHEYSVTPDFGADRLEEQDGDIPGLVDVWNAQLDDECLDFETTATDMLRSKMRELYKNLEQEYEHQTADEQIIEWIENNLHEDALDDEDVDELLDVA